MSRGLWYYGREIAAVIALKRMTTQKPNWRNIASIVKTSQPTLQPRLTCESQATVAQTSSATSGMRQNRATRTHPSGAGIGNVDRAITARTQPVGLRMAVSQIATLDQTGRFRKDCAVGVRIGPN